MSRELFQALGRGTLSPRDLVLQAIDPRDSEYLVPGLVTSTKKKPGFPAAIVRVRKRSCRRNNRSLTTATEKPGSDESGETMSSDGQPARVARDSLVRVSMSRGALPGPHHRIPSLSRWLLVNRGWHALRCSEGRGNLAETLSHSPPSTGSRRREAPTPFGVPQGVPPKPKYATLPQGATSRQNLIPLLIPLPTPRLLPFPVVAFCDRGCCDAGPTFRRRRSCCRGPV